MKEYTQRMWLQYRRILCIHRKYNTAHEKYDKNVAIVNKSLTPEIQLHFLQYLKNI